MVTNYEPRGREFESLRARQYTRPPAMGAFLICPIQAFVSLLYGGETLFTHLETLAVINFGGFETYRVLG